MMLIRIDKGSLHVATDHKEQVSGTSWYLDEQTDDFKALEGGDAASCILMSDFWDMLSRSLVRLHSNALLMLEFAECKAFLLDFIFQK